MNNLYEKISDAVNRGVQKALTISDNQDDDISIGWQHKAISNNVDMSGELKRLIDIYTQRNSNSNLTAIFEYISSNGFPEKAALYYKLGNSLYMLKQIIQQACIYDPTISLNWIDTSEIEDMSFLFAVCSSDASNKRYMYNGDISKWDVSKVVNMAGMFRGSQFTGDISKWNVLNVTDMSQMFKNNKCFKSDISGWKTQELISMSNMFENCEVFIDINDWDVSNVRLMNGTFKGWKGQIPDKYEKYDFSTNTLTYTYLSEWNVRQVYTMESMFQECFLFNSDLSKWRPARCKNMKQMFMHTCMFNSNVNEWPVSRVTNMTSMFYQAAAFNSPLNKWDVSSVEYMDDMFAFAHNFCQDISMWDTVSLASNDNMLPRNFPAEYSPVFDPVNMKRNIHYINLKNR